MNNLVFKKSILISTILIIIILIINCSSDNKVVTYDNTTCYLNLPQAGDDTLKASYFADTVLYVPLEPTSESLINNLTQLWINDSLILVNCYKGGLFLFKKDGSFVRRIGKIGHGPGEYLSIRNFCIIHDTVYISSIGKSSLLRYTIKGIFCDEIKLNYFPDYFNNTYDQKLASYIREEGKVLVYNTNYNQPDTIIVEYGVTKGRYLYSHTDKYFMPYFQKTATGLLFNSYLSDTVWNIEKKRKEPAYILNLKDRLLPYEKQIEFCNGDIKGWQKQVGSYNSLHIIPCFSYSFIFQKSYAGNQYNRFNAIYIKNNNTGEIKRYNTWFIYDDIVGKTKINVIFPVFSNEYLVALGSWRNVRKMEKSQERYKDTPSLAWIKQMKTIDEEANPILVLIKIKDNLK